MFFHWQAKRRPGQGSYSWTSAVEGVPTYSSTIKKVGTHGMLIEHPSSTTRDFVTYTSTAPAPDFFTLGVTMEFWLYVTTTGSTGSLVFNRVASSGLGITDFNIEVTSTSATTYFIQGTSTNSASSLNTNTWYHVAITQQSGGANDKLFIDGVGQSDSDTGNYVVYPTNTIYIGNSGNENNFNFYIDEFRVSIGLRYTANFTPTTTPFVADADTWLLAHFDNSLDVD